MVIASRSFSRFVDNHWGSIFLTFYPENFHWLSFLTKCKTWLHIVSSWSRNDTGFGLCQSFISPPPLPAGMMWGWNIFVCCKSVTCAFALWARVGLGLTRGRVVPLLTTHLAICQKRSNALKKKWKVSFTICLFSFNCRLELSALFSLEKVIGRFQILGRSLNIPLSPCSTAVPKHALTT